jgi:hypothetical protein
MSMSATLTRGDRARSPGPGSGSIRLLEHVSTATGSRVDREAGVIRRVKVLGRESANGRTYSDQAMHDAARLYEGARVNINHDRDKPTRERGLLEEFGTLKNVQLQEGSVYADLYYIKSHPLAELVLEKAERFPDKIGLSHNADGRGQRQAGKFVVESIERVLSVDLVLNPATTKGLFESAERPRLPTYEQRREAFLSGRSLRESTVYASEDPGGFASDDVIDRFARMLPESHEQIAKAYEAAALELVHLERTPGEIAKCMKALAMAREKLEQEFERGAAAAAATSPATETTPTVESVWQELQAKRAGKYPADVKQMAASLRR